MFSKLDVSDRQNWLEDRMIQDSVVIWIKGVLNRSQEKWTVKNRKMDKQKWTVLRLSGFILIEFGRRRVPNWMSTIVWKVGASTPRFRFLAFWTIKRFFDDRPLSSLKTVQFQPDTLIRAKFTTGKGKTKCQKVREFTWNCPE